MNKEEQIYWRKIGSELNLDLINNKIENLAIDTRAAAIWYILKGVLTTHKPIDQQCEIIRALRQTFDNNLAIFFNMENIPGTEHGERLLQHAIRFGKDDLISTILEEPAVNLSFESSVLRSTPLLLALMNGLQLEVVKKLSTKYSLERPNNQGTTPEAIAKTTDNTEFLNFLMEKKAVINRGFFQEAQEAKEAPQAVGTINPDSNNSYR